MNREVGYYWCRSGGSWEVAYWTGDNWLTCGGPIRYTDAAFDEIDPNPITR